jgi:hypothetical protein
MVAHHTLPLKYWQSMICDKKKTFPLILGPIVEALIIGGKLGERSCTISPSALLIRSTTIY